MNQILFCFAWREVGETSQNTKSETSKGEICEINDEVRT